MLKNKFRGYTIRVDLPKECGFTGYYVDCTYRYIKREKKFLLDMWLGYHGDNNRFKIELQKIDAQLITGTKETIVDNICKIIKQGSLSGFFTRYIKAYEYTYNCFVEGDKILSDKEVLDGTD